MTIATYRNFTGRGADNYQRYFVPAIATPVSKDLLRTAALRSGERVADVGCGTGVVARLAARAVGSSGAVTGVDVAPDMIDVARSLPAVDGADIDWNVGDAASLPLPDASCDVVLCQMALMFIEDRAGAVGEMRRVLVGDGRVVVNTPGPIQPAFDALEQTIVRHVSADLGGFVRAVFSLHDPATLEALLRGAQLRDVTATVAATTLRLPAPAEFLWQYISVTPMAPFVATATDEAHKAMELDFVERCRSFVDDGRLVVEQPMVIATARR